MGATSQRLGGSCWREVCSRESCVGGSEVHSVLVNE